MAPDEIREESSSTPKLASELSLSHRSHSLSYPAHERIRNSMDFLPSSPSEQTTSFIHWTKHLGETTSTPPSVDAHSIGVPDRSTDLSQHVNHHSSTRMAGTASPLYRASIIHDPPSRVAPPELFTARYSTSYPYGYYHIAMPATPCSSSIQQMNPRPSAQSFVTLPSFCDPDHVTGLTKGYPSSMDDASPQLWAGPQLLDQQSLDSLSSSHQGLESAQIANSKSLSTPKVVAAYATPTPTTVRSGTRADGSHRLPLPSEEVRINIGEVSARNQGVNCQSAPTLPGTKRKRKRAPNPPDVANRLSKRRTGAKDKATLDVGIHERQTNGGEFFRDASNTVIKDSKMTAIGIHLHGDHLNDSALQWLRGHAMRGVEHDSADRDPPPRCHPGTRTTIVQKVQDWLGNSEREKNLLWLRGAAGVGKSAIVQTLAESLSEAGRLGASLFFSRPNGRSDPRQIFPTLAYQFAIQDPSYKEYITQFVLVNPESLNKAINEQFRILIVEPFVRKGIRSGTEAWVVTLDGLDECGGDSNGRRHSNEVQCEVVRLISDFVRRYPTAPLTWMIASRPETHLKAVFSDPEVVPSFWEEEVPVDSDEACEDVEKFLHKEFMKIAQDYPDHIHDSSWPTNKQFLEIAHAALGLFIFAEVVVRFIGDPEVGNPIAQLECVLLAISNMRSNKNQENPLANLDVIYIAILSKIPPNTLPVTKRLLVFLILLNTRGVKVSDCNFRFMCQILHISEDIAVTALRHLHSVLYFPKAKDMGKTRPRFYHASFRDFLEDESRSYEYFVDKQTLTATPLIEDIVRITQAQFSSNPDSPLSPLPGEKYEDRPDDWVSKFVGYVFERTFSFDGVQLQKNWITDTVPDAQLQPLLESLSVVKLIKYGGYFVGRLMAWSSMEGDEPELIRRGFLSCTTFGALGINWDVVSMSTSKLGTFQRVHVDTAAVVQTKPRAGGPEVQEIRRCFKTAAPDTNVKVWGHRKSHCHVVVVVFDREYAITGVPLLTNPQSNQYS